VSIIVGEQHGFHGIVKERLQSNAAFVQGGFGTIALNGCANDIRSGLQEVYIIPSENATPSGICPEDSKRAIFPRDHYTHSAHDVMLNQERRDMEPLFSTQVEYDDWFLLEQRKAAWGIDARVFCRVADEAWFPPLPRDEQQLTPPPAGA
jgi:hypothetical protein